ncbi:MAG: aspartate aminotransferase family protein [Deltaproteobacteria bacterium]|jgi:glutamate-1-semialdehyde 2,1-aminomutase|nr:aspartate aminotransferase family protein [Deltaproteobacteria bacterium]
MSRRPKTDKSKALFEDAKKLFVDGVVNSLHKSAYEEYPLYIDCGKGSKVYDADGNEYIDYLGGYGPMILGYCPPAVTAAVREQLDKGALLAGPTVSVNTVSKKIIEIVPCAEWVIYQNTGTEAVMLAFRIARAYTGKDKIIRFEGHYHGWSDEAMFSNAPASLDIMGPRNRPWKVPGSFGQRPAAGEDIFVLPWNDLELLKETIQRHSHDIAAIIMEPVMCNCEVVYPKKDYLEGLRELTTENDIVLIFDEVITGFRLSLGGAQRYYNVTPDLCTLGKAVAGGMTLSCIAGRREVMDSGVKPRGTFNANPISMAACEATLNELEKPGVYENLERLTKRFTDGINKIAKKKKITLFCSGIPSIWQIAFGISEKLNDYRDGFRVDKMLYQTLRRGALERGIRLHPFRGRGYISTAHSDEDIEKTLSVIEDVLNGMF